MNSSEIIDACIPGAIKATIKRGLKEGDVVAHRNIEKTCSFIRAEGGVAFLSHVDDGVIEVPVDELFDPNVLSGLAQTFKHSLMNVELNAILPEGVKAITVRVK